MTTPEAKTPRAAATETEPQPADAPQAAPDAALAQAAAARATIVKTVKAMQAENHARMKEALASLAHARRQFAHTVQQPTAGAGLPAEVVERALKAMTDAVTGAADAAMAANHTAVTAATVAAAQLESEVGVTTPAQPALPAPSGSDGSPPVAPGPPRGS